MGVRLSNSVSVEVRVLCEWEGSIESGSAFDETKNIGVLFQEAPVEPADFVVLAVGVVIALLGAPHLVAHQQHRHAQTTTD